MTQLSFDPAAAVRHAEAVLQTWFHRRDIHGAYGKGGAYKEDAAPTVEVVRAHLQGGKVIGTYPVRQDDQTARWIAFDIDAHSGAEKDAAEAKAMALCQELTAMGVTPLLEDSGGGFHVWLYLESPVPARDAYAWAKALAERYGIGEWWPAYTDPASVGKFLRLPGRHHTLEHWSSLLDFSTGEWVAWPDCLELFADPVPAPASIVPPAPPPEVKRRVDTPANSGGDLELVRRCLRFIKCYGAGTHDEGWLTVLMAIHDESGGSEGGFRIADEWSCQGGDAYDPKVLRRKWNSFGSSGSTQVTVGTLVHMAREAGASDADLLPGQRKQRVAKPCGTDEMPESGEADGDAPQAPTYSGPLGVTLRLRDARKTGRSGAISATFSVERDGRFLGALPLTTSPTGLRAAETHFCQIVGDDLGRKLSSSEKAALRGFVRIAIAPDRLRAAAAAGGTRPDSGPRSTEVVTDCLRAHARPGFRGTKGYIWFEAFERSMNATEFAKIVPRELLHELGWAVDLNPDAADTTRTAAVHRLAAVTFHTFQRELPTEADAGDLGPGSAAARAMKSALKVLWHTPTGFRERAPTLAFAALQEVEKGGQGWRPVLPGGGLDAYVHADGPVLALRHDLAQGQVPRQLIESASSLAGLGRILLRYGLLHSSCPPDGKVINAGRQYRRVLILSKAMTSEILHGEDGPPPVTGTKA